MYTILDTFTFFWLQTGEDSGSFLGPRTPRYDALDSQASCSDERYQHAGMEQAFWRQQRHYAAPPAAYYQYVLLNSQIILLDNSDDGVGD
jgi:hypothetical protein